MLEQVRAAVATRNAAVASLAAGVAGPGGVAPGAPNAPAQLRVPYGELPLAPARVESLRALFTDLQRRDYTGVVRVALHSGEFCLMEAAAGGHVLADPATPVAKCSLVGNPYLDNLNAADRQPVSFANLVATVESESGGRVDIELAERGKQDAIVPYPTGDGVLAGDWNRAALANNRVSITVDGR
jgi:hypothetical protein